MGRTTGPDEVSSRAKKGDRGRGLRSTQSRSVLISKACSRLLRHQAVNEGIPISTDGWVRLDHLLAWKGLSSRNGLSPPPTIEEIWEVVEENEKKRFAVRRVIRANEDEVGIRRSKSAEKTSPSLRRGSEDTGKTTLNESKAPVTTITANDLGASHNDILNQPVTTVKELLSHDHKQQEYPNASGSYDKLSADPEQQDDSETAQAIAHYRGNIPSPSAAEFQIRAVQGHSIQTVVSDTSLLKAITLDDPESVPDTCVHGTFYGAWPLILRSGGLKRMGRNHVHFASGPSLAEIGIDETSGAVEGEFGKVISGMRRDAQLLIYVDLKRCLQDLKESGLQMSWWMSENGVILTEGVDDTSSSEETGAQDIIADSSTRKEGNSEQEQLATNPASADEAVRKLDKLKVNERDNGGGLKVQKSKQAQATAQSNKLVPTKYWKMVVDVKGGHGIIWEQGRGVVNELPERLVSRANPKVLRGNRGLGRGRGR